MTCRLAIMGVLFCTLAMGLTPASASPRGCENASLHSTLEDIQAPPDFTSFGAAVAISSYTALVGLPNYANPETEPRQRGRVAIFTCDPRTRAWSRTGSLDPTDHAEDEFSFGMAVFVQGHQAVVGAQNAVRLYEKRDGTWQPVLKLKANGTDEFIESGVAYDAPYLAITRSKLVTEQVMRFIEIYRVNEGRPARLIARLRPPEDFGPLALNNGTLVAGLYVYTRQHGKWRLQQQLAPDETPPPDSDFGSVVAIHRNTILVGSPREGLILGDEGPIGGGAVYVFERRHGTWQQVQRIRPDTAAFNGFGATLALNGRFAAIGAPFAYGAFQRDFGPTFLYRVSAGVFLLDRTLENVVATSMDISRRHLMVGTSTFAQGFPNTGAAIFRLPPLHEVAESPDDELDPDE